MSGEPIILSGYDPGVHAGRMPETLARLERERSWQDLSTVIVTPAGGSVPTKCVASWLGMIKPPNNKCVHLWAIGAEVGHAYSRMIEHIIAHPELGGWKYLMTLEHDQSVPADCLVRLQQRMEEHPEFAAISALYWTKGEGGVAQIWGDPSDKTGLNFRPQRPDPAGGLVECNGLGMGACLYRLSMFKDERLRRPWFRTTASVEEGTGTQDLFAWSDFKKHGYRCAVDTGCRVGHMDVETGVIW